MRKTFFDILIIPFLLIGVSLLAVWWFGVQIATALKPCDKGAAKRRPRRAF